jgi:hypothetical protein
MSPKQRAGVAQDPPCRRQVASDEGRHFRLDRHGPILPPLAEPDIKGRLPLVVDQDVADVESGYL